MRWKQKLLPEPDAITPRIAHLADAIPTGDIQWPPIKHCAESAQVSDLPIKVGHSPINYRPRRTRADFFVGVHYFQGHTADVEMAVIVGVRLYANGSVKDFCIPLGSKAPIRNMEKH